MALRSLAGELGMGFSEEDEWSVQNLLKDFSLFRKGHSRRIFNLLSSSSEFMEEKVSVFDYSYVIQAGNTPVRHHQTVFSLQSKRLALPQMLLKPETFFHKIGAWIGMQDLDFEAYPEFSSKYLLQGEEETRVRSVFDDDVVRFFIVGKKWYMESIGYYLVLYRARELFEPASIKQLLSEGGSLYQMLKSEPE